jgi:hypothetical protein
VLLEKKQNTLKTKMDQQQGQLKKIQTELNSLSSNANTHFLATDFSHLKVYYIIIILDTSTITLCILIFNLG